MNKNKYVIANCPACYLYGDKYGCENNHDEQGRDTYCELVSDCVMKQITEKCKKYIENYNDKVFYDEDDVKILMGKVMLSQSILSEFLEIQEIE